MKIKTKLLIAFVSILAMMLIAGTFSIIGIEKLYNESIEIGTKNAPLADARDHTRGDHCHYFYTLKNR